MTQEIIIAIFLAILTIPLAVLGATMPKTEKKIVPIVVALSIIVIVILLVLYIRNIILSEQALLYAAIAAIISVFSTKMI